MNDGGWMELCRLGSGALTLGRWRQELRGVFPVCRRWIEKTGRPVGHVKRGRCGCNHRLVPDMDGDGFVAVCTCGAGGEPVAMTEAKARAWVLNGRAVVKEMAAALPVEVCVKAVGRHLLWEIGSGWTLTGHRRRVLVSLAGKRAVLEAALGDLFTHGLRDFVLLVADPEWCGSDLGPRLESVGGDVHAIGGFIEMRGKALARGPLVKRLLADAPVVGGAGGQASDAVAVKATTKPDGVLRPIDNWDRVILKGREISLCNREKAKQFLRYLWAKGATRYSKAIPAGERYTKPSSMFVPGETPERNKSASLDRYTSTPNESGRKIHRVYRDGVGKVPPAKKGKGATKFYLKVFKDSDVT